MNEDMKYQQCNNCVMDSSDSQINFDENQQNKASRIVSIDEMSNVKVIRS